MNIIVGIALGLFVVWSLKIKLENALMREALRQKEQELMETRRIARRLSVELLASKGGVKYDTRSRGKI